MRRFPISKAALISAALSVPIPFICDNSEILAESRFLRLPNRIINFLAKSMALSPPCHSPVLRTIAKSSVSESVLAPCFISLSRGLSSSGQSFIEGLYLV